MAAIDLLKPFRRVQPQDVKDGVSRRELNEMQARLEASIGGLTRFCQTVMPTGSLLVHPGLTAAQIASDFDANLNGIAGRAFEGWRIASELDGRFLRLVTSAAGGTGGSDSSAHTHAVDVASFTSGAETGHTHSTPAHSHAAGGLFASIDGNATQLFVDRNVNSWTSDRYFTISGVTSSSDAQSNATVVGGSTATDGSGTSGASSGHTHTIDPPNTTSGAASNTENRPAYYEAVPLVRL